MPDNTPPFTLAIIIITVAVYVLINLGLGDAIIRPLLISQYIRPTLPEIHQGQWWRLVTPMFLHFSIFHIVFNMLWTWELGRIIEWRQGAWLLAILMFAISVISNLAQYLVTGPLFGGMSGVVYGLFGYIWIQSWTNPRFRLRLNPVIVKLMLGWFLLCWSGLLEKFFGLAVANTAHSAGLASGIAAALIISGITHSNRK